MIVSAFIQFHILNCCLWYVQFVRFVKPYLATEVAHPLLVTISPQLLYEKEINVENCFAV